MTISKKLLRILVIVTLVAACEDRTAEDWENIRGGTNSDQDISGDVEDVAFDETTDKVTIDVAGTSKTFVRDVNGDLGEYQSFIEEGPVAEDAFTAFIKTSADEAVTGVVVSNGASGGTQITASDVTLPESGVVNYTGAYIGFMQLPGDAENIVTGDTSLEVEFGGYTSLEGRISNREFGPNGTGTIAPDVVLGAATVGADGSFNGAAGDGAYAGTFGGENASSIGGAVAIEDEYGIFVLSR